MAETFARSLNLRGSFIGAAHDPDELCDIKFKTLEVYDHSTDRYYYLITEYGFREHAVSDRQMTESAKSSGQRFT